MTNTAEVYQFPAHADADKPQEVQVVAEVENGYTRLANDLVLQLCRTDLSKRESKVMFAVISKTFGFNKPCDWIGRDQIEELTGIAANHVSAVIKGLVERKILYRKGRAIGVNKVISEWRTSESSAPTTRSKNSQKSPNGDYAKNPQTGTKKSPNRDSKVPERGRISPQTRTHKRQDTFTKDTNTKNKGLDLSVVPGWLNAKTVEDFIDHRRAIKKPMTQVALTRLINKLDNFRVQGIDPVACLDESIVNGWQGVFPPKQGANRATAQPRSTGPDWDDTSWAHDLGGL
jgi:phage replication O-like protein O